WGARCGTKGFRYPASSESHSYRHGRRILGGTRKRLQPGAVPPHPGAVLRRRGAAKEIWPHAPRIGDCFSGGCRLLQQRDCGIFQDQRGYGEAPPQQYLRQAWGFHPPGTCALCGQSIPASKTDRLSDMALLCHRLPPRGHCPAVTTKLGFRGQVISGIFLLISTEQAVPLAWAVRCKLRRSPVAKFLHRLWSDQRGQDVAEYAVMLAVILVIVVGTIRLIGGNANNVFSSVASSISQ